MSGERPHYPNGWPVLEADIQLPGLDLRDAETVEERLERLALAYGTMAATYHQLWPRAVQALEWLRGRLEHPPTGAPPMRAPMQSVEDIVKEAVDDFKDEVEDIITGQHAIPALPAVDSERVRAIAAEEIERKETDRLAQKARADEAEDKLAAIERAKRPWQIIMAIVTAVLSLAVVWLGWLLTHK